MATMTVEIPRIHIPAELEFGDDQFTPAPDLTALGQYLISTHEDVLGHLADVEIAFFWKRTGGKKSGSPVFGKEVKPSGLITAFTTADAVVWLASDHVSDADYSPRQVEALLFHEMQHIGVEEPEDEDGERKIVMRSHDIEAFYADIRKYGAWDEMLRETAAAFKQAGLFD